MPSGHDPRAEDMETQIPLPDMHRCGWTVGYPLLRWVRFPSWIDYHFRD
ncbi:hypothetical protein [Natrinema halophilum]|uniref:Uncharacterized protein n=1 Tax=Natrinema halophilum TaxID=1699371 RepID=A0A7D5KRC9_9EURY|nr:hypothetical protein [Natrinema halophilum]QLG48324.1 hypothetical protein HYG82_05405 [Natrinema halophilum]